MSVSAPLRQAAEPGYGWVVVWASFASLAIVFGVAYSFAAFFESFTRDFQADRADVSVVFGLSGLLYFVLGAGGGMLADRYGPRRVATAGMLCIAAGLGFASVAQSLAGVYVAYGVGIGVGIALVYTPSIGAVPPWFSARRGLASGLASAGIGAGTLLVPLLAAALIAAGDWRTTMRVLALLALVAGVAATLLLRRAPTVGGAAGAPPAGTTLRDALRSGRFWSLYVAVGFGGVAMFMPFAHVSAAARDLGIADAPAVGLVGLIGIGSLAGRFAIGALADRFGRPRTLVLMLLAMGASFVLWQIAGGYRLMATFAVIFGIAYGGIVSLLPAIVMDVFGARAVSGIIGALYTGAAFGNLAGPVAAGAVFDRFGSYAPVIVGCIACSAASALAASRLLRTRQPAGAAGLTGPR